MVPPFCVFLMLVFDLKDYELRFYNFHVIHTLWFAFLKKKRKRNEKNEIKRRSKREKLVINVWHGN